MEAKLVMEEEGPTHDTGYKASHIYRTKLHSQMNMERAECTNRVISFANYIQIFEYTH